MPLTDISIRNAKGQEKPYRMSDGRGLFLIVNPNGSKWWRFTYAFQGKTNTLSLGVYPDIPLKIARERRDTARTQVAIGIDPAAQRKAAKLATQERRANSFEVLAREWYELKAPEWSEGHQSRVLRLLEKDLFPYIGKLPITDLTPQKMLEVARRVQQRSVELAHRALDNAGNVFRFAIRTGRATTDPTRDLGDALPTIRHRHYASQTDPQEVARLLRKLDLYQGTFPVSCALRLAPLVFVRPGELRQAKWADIDLEAREWRFIASKTNTAHIVPLATQAMAILTELHQLTGRGVYVFPGARSQSRPISENTLNAALRTLDIPPDQFTGHGFRAMARTLLDEVLNYRPDLIEHQLAHSVRDPLGRAYNRTSHLPERTAMMQAWADYLDRLKAGGKVVPLRKVG